MSAALTTPSQIERFRWVSIRGGLKLEKLGLKKHGKSCRQVVLQASGLPVSTKYDELIQWCTDRIEEFE